MNELEKKSLESFRAKRPLTDAAADKEEARGETELDRCAGDIREAYSDGYCDGHTAAEQSASRRPEARALELWAMDCLDWWAACETACADRFEWTTSKQVPASKGWRCVLRGITQRPVRDFTAPSGPAARIAAARALKLAHPELPDEPKGSE